MKMRMASERRRQHLENRRKEEE